ncbi:MAG: 2-dehydro-3-deoxygalactonokinase [Halioglobus sp.]
MTENVFIAGDWGTTNLRLYLCQFNQSEPTQVLGELTGPGVSQLNGEFEQVFFELAGTWLAEHGPVPVILSGMVGSTIGWREAPYLECPVAAEQIVAGRTHFQAGGLEFSIIAGLKVKNPLGTPDLMRGEELQLLGWMRSGSVLEAGEHLVALPGTHNKWVLLKNGRLETFVTAVTGELFSLLCKHSILIAEPEVGSFSTDAFMQGVRAICKVGGEQLLHAIFATRSRQVLGEMSERDASSYLSGLLVGSDVIGAKKLFGERMSESAMVTLIGDSALSHCYQLVLEYLGIKVETCDARRIAIAGYEAIYKSLYTEG